MTKKWILIVGTGLICALMIVVYLFVPGYALKIITDYAPYTFERVLSDPEMRIEYGINQLQAPEDYGFLSEEFDYLSLDSTALNGWYIQSSRPTDKCMIFIHGRTSNRLKTMKYLALVDTFDLDTAYNIFIPDLRNSGRSAATKTFMGYKFGEDVVSSMQLMHEQYRQDTFFLYGFSMGAMAIANALGRPELKSILEQERIVVEKIIFDSPLANVKATLREQSSGVPLAGIFFDQIFEGYSNAINHFGENMSLSKLLPDNIPVLILQSKNDHTTNYLFLNLELEEMKDNRNIEVVYFEGPGHVKLFQDERTKESYIKAVDHFLIATSKKHYQK